VHTSVLLSGDGDIPTTLETEFTPTDRDRTTVGDVVLTRAPAESADLVICQFLDVLARDIAMHPERHKRIDPSLVQRGRDLTAGVEFDRDAPLSPQDD
jgi:antitoxin PrlF